MEQLKRNGFVIGLVAMVLFLVVFAYLHVFRASSSYGQKADSLRRVALSLRNYAQRKPEELPTKELLQKRGDEKKKLEEAWGSAEQFYAGVAKKLEELRFQPDGEVYDIEDEAGISNAFLTAINQLNDAYKKVREEYIKKVFPPEALKGVDLTWSPIEVKANFATPEQRKEAAARCRIARAIFQAAIASNWGGMTYINFERRITKKTTSTAAKKTSSYSRKRTSRKSSRYRSYRRRQKKKKLQEVKPVDPRDLYEKIKVTVAGEMRFQDLAPFLAHLYRQAQDPKDPVLFIVEKIVMAKQADRVLSELYEKQYPNEDEARKAPLDSEVKIPTATVRLVLSAIKWKGLPKEEPQP